jgi:hypothetical protein
MRGFATLSGAQPGQSGALCHIGYPVQLIDVQPRKFPSRTRSMAGRQPARHARAKAGPSRPRLAASFRASRAMLPRPPVDDDAGDVEGQRANRGEVDRHGGGGGGAGAPLYALARRIEPRQPERRVGPAFRSGRAPQPQTAGRITDGAMGRDRAAAHEIEKAGVSVVLRSRCRDVSVNDHTPGQFADRDFLDSLIGLGIDH